MNNAVRYARCETPKPYWESSKNVATRRWYKSLESYVIRKAVTRSSAGGRWKSALRGNSLAAHPTARPVCAVRRSVVSLAQPGRTQKEVLGSPNLPGPEREREQEHVVESGAGMKTCRPRCCKTRVLWRELHCPIAQFSGE